MKSLQLIDPDTGERSVVGDIAQQQRIGPWDVWLVYNDSEQIWWIITRKDEAISKFGYTLERREICWQVFLDLDEALIMRLQADAAAALPS